jgi:hypothetical protein
MSAKSLQRKFIADLHLVLAAGAMQTDPRKAQLWDALSDASLDCSNSPEGLFRSIRKILHDYEQGIGETTLPTSPVVRAYSVPPIYHPPGLATKPNKKPAVPDMPPVESPATLVEPVIRSNTDVGLSVASTDMGDTADSACNKPAPETRKSNTLWAITRAFERTVRLTKQAVVVFPRFFGKISQGLASKAAVTPPQALTEPLAENAAPQARRYQSQESQAATAEDRLRLTLQKYNEYYGWEYGAGNPAKRLLAILDSAPQYRECVANGLRALGITDRQEFGYRADMQDLAEKTEALYNFTALPDTTRQSRRSPADSVVRLPSLPPLVFYGRPAYLG